MPGEATTYLVVLGEAAGGPDEVLARHVGRRAPDTNGQGGLCAVFADVRGAAAAACELQGLFGAAGRLRMAIHEGGAEPGSALAAMAHGGQILLSAGAARLAELALPAGAGLKDLGRHRLADLRSAEQVFQLTPAGSPDEFPPLISPDTVPNNLPVQVTRFVGRVRELAELRQLLAEGARLVTLTGPGGSGKTRMAVQLAAGLLDRFPDGVYMVDLSGLADPLSVAGAVASVLKVREEPGRTPAEGVAAILASRRVLLVLDNCEHLITASARLASTLLLECPHLRLIATSREPLGIAGERVWQVPPLTVPDSGALLDAGTVTGFEAVQLFMERARAVSPVFAVTDGNAAALATVCKRLDGVPLAIELAAARTRLLSVEQIADRLDDRLRLLSAGGRGALPRHQTLRAAIDWSYDLLTEAERVLWRRLAVFADRFSLEAAEAICVGGPIDDLDVLELLAQLVDKSLVAAEEVRGEKRYRLLETIRQYGRERLREAGEEADLLAVHRAWCVRFAREATLGLSGADQGHWTGRVELEQENLRQAVQGSLDAGEAGPALEICGLLWTFLLSRAQFTEARELLERVLAVAETQQVDEIHKAHVVRGLGIANTGLGDFAEAERYYARSLSMAREVGDPPGEARTLVNWGLLKLYRNEYPEAQRLLEEAMEVGRRHGLPQILPPAMINLATIYSDQGDFATARRYLDEANAEWIRLGRGTFTPTLEVLAGISLAEGNLEAAEELYGKALVRWRANGDARGIGVALTGLANVALLRGEPGRSRELVTESIRLRQSIGDSLGQAASLETFAWLAAAEGSPVRAMRLAGGADAVRRRLGTPLPPVRAQRSDRLLAPARQALGADVAAEAFAAGARMPLPELVELACAPAAGGGPARAQAPAAASGPAAPKAAGGADAVGEDLTPRELEILRLAARGLTAREVGQKLYLSPRTVEKHEENIRTKLDLPNRAALVAWAVRRGLVDEDSR
jgi:non-specific serine/threonine protein kinase